MRGVISIICIMLTPTHNMRTPPIAFERFHQTREETCLWLLLTWLLIRLELGEWDTQGLSIWIPEWCFRVSSGRMQGNNAITSPLELGSLVSCAPWSLGWEQRLQQFNQSDNATISKTNNSRWRSWDLAGQCCDQQSWESMPDKGHF